MSNLASTHYDLTNCHGHGVCGFALEASKSQYPPAVPGECARALEGDQRMLKVTRFHQLGYQHDALILPSNTP